ncbi:MAG: hypothetical protein NXH83_10205 [Rhodobacteraceae bacterium]|nr:hypothetical protein [Paracoccaceae bacterium]
MEFSHRHGTAVLAALSVVVLAGVFLVPSGFFNIDEAIHFLGADSLRRTGSFATDNGFAEFGSDNLKLWFLVEGQGGLVPQYPAGHAVFGSVLLALFGFRGLFLLNAVAAVATLFVTRALARRMFRDERVAFTAALILALASFWPDYVVAIWPHSAALLCVTLAFHLALGALDAGERSIQTAVLAGLAAGLGLLFRADAVLILPVLVALAILFAARPVAMLAGGLAGLTVPLAAVTALNAAKFGVALPISYGAGRGGGTALASHGLAAAALAAGLGLLVGWRAGAARPQIQRRLATLAAAGLFAGAAALPAGRDLALRIADGALGLFVVAQRLDGSVVSVGPAGTVLFGGLPKKALAQSLPWLGLLPLGFWLAWTATERRALAAILVFVLVWSLPFVPFGWHGGLGGNMRYFLPLLPLLVALGARILWAWADRTERPGRRLAIGAAAGLSLAGLWAALDPAGAIGVQQRLTLALFLCLAAITVIAQLRHVAGPHIRGFAALLTGAGLSIATLCAVFDLENSVTERAWNSSTGQALAGIEGRVLVWGNAKLYRHQLSRTDQIVAMPIHQSGEIDAGLLSAALARGYRIYVPDCIRPLVARAGKAEYLPAVYDEPCGGLYELQAFVPITQSGK